MIDLDKTYPNYGLASHKGYITALHTEAIKKYGVLPIHRKSFANIAALLN
jgi:ribonuclease HII